MVLIANFSLYRDVIFHESIFLYQVNVSPCHDLQVNDTLVEDLDPILMIPIFLMIIIHFLLLPPHLLNFPLLQLGNQVE